MINFLKKRYYSLFLLLFLAFSSGALADTISAVDNKTDLSIAYLSSFFGTVSGVLTGTSGQMFGKLMYQFNQGVLIVAACWLIFTTITVVFKAVAHGSFNQQDNKVIMIILRIALGFSLLICSPTTGYTPLQGIIMKVVVEGVKLADQIWDYGLDYMNSGGSLWSRPVQQGTTGSTAMDPSSILSGDDLNKILGQPTVTTIGDDNSMVQKIITMEACMVQAQVDYENNSNNSVSVPADFTPDEDLTNFKFIFPGKPGSICGAISWQKLVGKTFSDCSAGSAGDDNSGCGYSQLAMKEVIFDLLPAVKKSVCIDNANHNKVTDYGVCGGIDPSTSADSEMTDAMFNATLGFKNLIDPVVRADLVPPSSNNSLKFITQARQDGWLTAGRYYWDMLRVESFYDHAITGSGNYGKYTSSSYDSANTSIDYDSPANLIKASGPYIQTVTSQINTYSGAADTGQGAVSMPKEGAWKWLMMILGPIIGQLMGLIMSFSTHMGPLGLGPEPMIWLHNIGAYCLSLGVDMWIGTGLTIFALTTATSVCSAVNPLPFGVKALVDWIQPIILAAGAGFFVIGMMLGYYNPIHPYMVFTFGVLNWIIQVIYAVIAGSLVAMGITHPEGHDFLGSAKQFPMLLLNVFFRPSLMVIGLFAGMILCQAISGFLLYTYSGFISDIFYTSSPISGTPGHGDMLLNSVGLAMGHMVQDGGGDLLTNLILPLFAFPIFLGIFTTMIYTTTVLCFSLIYEVGDYVGEWIGAPRPHSINHNQVADQVKHGFSGAAGKMGEAGTRSRMEKSDNKASLEGEEQE
ncbi:MAG: DotA/TraY family protein [Proteobacteria bacterium]|nr:DotA/TraY family protein [Pseudomonadota bacterium]